MKIGKLSPAFSVFETFTKQSDFNKMIVTCTAQVIEELDDCSLLTSNSRLIDRFPWPRNHEIISFCSRENYVDKAKIEEAVADEAPLLQSRKNLVRENRAVKVSVLKLGWFFNEKQNFITFAKLINNLPSKVYASMLLDRLIDQYWTAT